MPLFYLILLILVVPFLLFAAFNLVVPLALAALGWLAFGRMNVTLWRFDRLWALIVDADARTALRLQKATMTVLRKSASGKAGVALQAGAAAPRGFFVETSLQPSRVADAARRALKGLRDGEDLTSEGEALPSSVTLVSLILALVLWVFLLLTRHFTLFTVVLAGLSARALAPALARIFEQRWLFEGDLSRVAVLRAERNAAARGRNSSLFVVQDGGVFVSLSFDDDVVDAEEVD